MMKNLLPILLALALHFSSSAIAGCLVSPCSGPAANDPFADNLSKLMSLLLREAPAMGFGLGSVGHGEGRAHGLAMCRGDLSSSACAACIHEANARILRRCPSRKEATLWLDLCLLRYADHEFFGEMDESLRVYASHERNRSKTSAALDAGLERLMERLVREAHLSPLLFATGEAAAGASGSFYGLVQCTRDLSGGDCKRCLSVAIAELRSSCHGGRGGRVVGGSCNLRYELHPFYDSS